MRLLPLVAVSLAALAAAAGLQAPPGARGQERGKKCPAVSVTCAELVRSGVPTVFTVNVGGGEANVSPSYEWSVSAGTISSGQGESSMTVDTTGLAVGPKGQESVTATVKVGGFAPECRAGASCTTEVYINRHYFPVDEYGSLRWGDEKARLDNYATHLKDWPDGDGYVICYGGRRGRRGEAQARCARARNYLVTRHKIPAGRLVAIDGGYMEKLTVVLWPMPRGVD